MAITVEEKADSRSGDGVNQLDLRFIVRGSDDDAAVRAALMSNTASAMSGLLRQPPEAEPLGPLLWEGKVRYQKPDGSNRESGTASFSFDTTGGSQHITQSLSTVQRYGEAPDFGGAIGVTNDAVEGVDITVPTFGFSVTRYFKASQVPAGYFGLLYMLTGKTNDSTWTVNVDGVSITFQRGECLFQGASGSKRSSEDWEVTFRFAASPNASDLAVGEITGIAKRGWQYLWVRYADVEDEEAVAVVKKPVAVYIEQVYEEGDFQLLGI